MEKCMADIDNMVRVRLEQADSIRGDVSEYDKGVIEMRRLANKLEEINTPKKRWWHFWLGIKPVPKPMTSAIYEMTYGTTTPFTENEISERDAFLAGYEAGRRDGDAHAAHRLWLKIRENSREYKNEHK